VLVVGTHGTAALVAHELDDVPDFEILPQAGALASLAPIVDAQRPDLIVLTDERTYGDALDRLLETPAAAGRVVGLSGFFEYTLRRVPVSHLSPAWFMSLVHLRQPLYGRWTKRAFDVVMAAIGLLVALPLMAVVAAVVSRSPGPLLFRQTRLGEGGRPFTILKFRTMVPDAESDGPQFAAERDPRLIPGGSLLRRAHLDELPQLWNVLRGEMSVVGPRPERPEVASSLEDAVPFWNRRLLVKPGVTGWAQVCCGYVADCAEMADKLAYDLWYLRNQSLLVDIAICLRTVGQLLGAFVPGLSPARGDAR
jgi:lipopolysaccharide/colanic/teichoic acid biosynthesis glycosyltransferase